MSKQSRPTPDAGHLLIEGLLRKIEEDSQRTRDEAGVLRGGSVGSMQPDGTYIGKCIRASAARFLGVEPERDPIEWAHKQFMFEAGHSNEDDWVDALKLVWNGKILREEEYPIEWKIDGVKATGREDIVLCHEDGEPALLVELKLVSSLNTAITVLGGLTPKTEHAIQVANYMYRTGLPAQLWYMSRVRFPIPDWKYVRVSLPKDKNDIHHPAYPYVIWSGPRQGRPPQPTGLDPFIVGFDFRWSRSGQLGWKHTESNTWQSSIITKDGIDNYYRAVLRTAKGEELPSPNVTLDLTGGKPSYNPCDYCEWHQSVCSRATTASEWLELISNAKQRKETT